MARKHGSAEPCLSSFDLVRSPLGARFLTGAALFVLTLCTVSFGSTQGVVVDPPVSPLVKGGGELVIANDPGVPNAVAGGWLEFALFNVVAGGVVISVIGVCISRNIVRMAVWLFMCLGSVAMVYFMLAATFLGAIQLIVYAGGTLVLLIFGVMLTSKSPWVKFEAGVLETVLAGGVCVALTAALCLIFARTTWHATEAIVPGPAITMIGEQLITKFLVPFEVAGVLLFIVMVGAAYLARQED